MALMAYLLREYSNETVDIGKVMLMCLIHDVVEIDAGDTFAYDDAGYASKAEREQKAADRLFGLLPKDQGAELRTLWEEFEAGSTPEARFAAALDRIQPLMLNYTKRGKTWNEHGIRAEQVKERIQPIFEGSETLGCFAEQIIELAVREGILPAGGQAE